MFFRPTPSKLDQAKQTARDAASAVSSAAGSMAETVAESAHSFREHAPKIAANVGEAVSAKASAVGSAVSATASTVGSVVAAKASNVGESLSSARDVVAAKVDAVRHRAVNEAEDSVEAAQLKAATTRKAADVATREAERATREAQKKAEAEIARDERELLQKRAEFERGQTELQQRAARFDEARVSSQEQADEIHARRKATIEVERPELAKVEDFTPIEPEPPTRIEVPVPAQSPSRIELQDADDDFEYQIVAEKQSGSKLWILVGAVVFVGAGVAYFFTSRNGRRSRAAIQDRLSKVKDQAVEKVTGAADAASANGQIDTFAEATSSLNQTQEADFADATLAVETHEDIAQTETLPLSDEVEVASANAVEGVAVEAYEPLGHIETAATAGSELDEPHHPNIFDKVAGIVGNVAGVAEHLAGEEKDGAKETAEEIEAAAETAKHESKEEREATTKKKKNK